MNSTWSFTVVASEYGKKILGPLTSVGILPLTFKSL